MRFGVVLIAMVVFSIWPLGAGPLAEVDIANDSEAENAIPGESAGAIGAQDADTSALLLELEEEIRRATDTSKDPPGHPNIPPWTDWWNTPRELAPTSLAGGYFQRKQAELHGIEGFASSEEEAYCRDRVVSCLIGLLDEPLYPGLRMEAARNLGKFALEELRGSTRNEIESRLLLLVCEDSSPSVRIEAAVSLFLFDDDSRRDERVNGELAKIAKGEDVIWRIEDTDIRRGILDLKELSEEEGLEAFECRWRIRAFELLSLSITSIPQSERSALVRSAEVLASNLTVDPIIKGARESLGEERSAEIESKWRADLLETLTCFLDLASPTD